MNKTNATSPTTNTSHVKTLTLTGLFTAIIFVATVVIQIPVSATNGYIHFGDAFIFIAGIVLGPFYGAFAAGVGSALSDVYAGYYAWALPTLLIKSIMGYIVGYMFAKNDTRIFKIIGGILSAGWLVFCSIIFLSLGNITESSATFQTIADDLTYDDVVVPLSEVSTYIQNMSHMTISSIVVLPLLGVLLYFIAQKISKHQLDKKTIISFLLAGIVMVFGYYLTYGILYGNFILPMLSVPMNIIQFIIGILIASLLYPVILPMKRRYYS